MAKVIKVRLSSDSIDQAVRELTDYRNSLQSKAAKLAERLANAGFEVAFSIMAGHVYSGETLSSLTVMQLSDTKFVLTAGSVALLFLEFGAGFPAVADEHELAGDLGMGIGTYPGQTHAFDQNGWWFETDDANLAKYTTKSGKMYAHSYGVTPRKPFYAASVEMRDSIVKIAREVFAE